jgi:hypothetical protein
VELLSEIQKACLKLILIFEEKCKKEAQLLCKPCLTARQVSVIRVKKNKIDIENTNPPVPAGRSLRINCKLYSNQLKVK